MADEVKALRRKVAQYEAREQVAVGLEDGEALFGAVFESAGVGIGLADPNGRILKVNRAFADMLGYEASELAGKHIADIT
ncbi:MAG: PAS domain S-box protein, partial [Rhodospirillaceae bacterium]|nr:PAS domain S-box protein [Rhodospirillaceae bacterium]